MKHTGKLPPPCAFVFDLDGVVVNTRLAVEAAYRHAGVEMPADAWGKPWREWCSEKVHHAKNLAYRNALIEHATPGPLLWLVRKLRTEVLVLTGASPDAVNIVKRVFEIDFRTLGFERTPLQKVEKLRELSKTQQVVYFDDNPVIISGVQLECPRVTTVLVDGDYQKWM